MEIPHPADERDPSSSRRDVAQPGRALAWGARGRQFKSARPDHLLLEILRCAQDFACELPSLRASRPQDGSSSNLRVPTTCSWRSFAALRISPADSRRYAPHARKTAQVQICPSRPLAPRDPSLRSGFRLRTPVATLLTPARRLKFKSARPDHLLLEILRCAQDFACGLPSLRASRPQTGSSSNLPVPTTFQRTGPAAIFSDSRAF